MHLTEPSALRPAPASDPTPRGGEILCVGECLWDSLPDGLYPGGAPFNAASHLRALGWSTALVSRVGDDRLGRELLRRMGEMGVRAELVQRDPVLETGFAGVVLDAAGVPGFEIASPAAWDALDADAALVRRAAEARAVVFGTLAQRSARAADAVQRIAGAAPFRVLDLNLRPPHAGAEVVERSLELAHLVKLNDDELATVSAWLDLGSEPRGAVEALADRFDCRAVCVTRGAQGAALWTPGEWVEVAGISVSVVDTVGAGDAFLAGLLDALLGGAPARDALRAANELGAFVATRRGAIPRYTPGEVEAFHRAAAG